METPRETMNPIHDLLKRRWSPRAFADRLVEHDKLRSLFEAARWAPSAFNAQPWSFIVATKEDRNEYERLFDCLPAPNQRWAHFAPVLALAVTNLYVRDTEEPNRFAFHDLGLAVENLAIEATALGLSCHQAGGIDIKKARNEFQIPPAYEPVDIIAIGYEGNPEELPDDLRQAELARRVRKPLHSFVFSVSWGLASPILAQSNDMRL